MRTTHPWPAVSGVRDNTVIILNSAVSSGSDSDGRDIDEDDRIPPEYLVTGTEVHAKVRCGNRAMGYSLFYGVWEFFYEKVVWFF